MGPLDQLIKNLSKLPGVGRKSASRMAFQLLKAKPAYLQELSESIATIQDKIIRCEVCGNFTEHNPCEICSDPSRDKKTICIVEQVQDLMMLNQTGEYKGQFFVLHGVISPLDGVGAEELHLPLLAKRVKDEEIQELIIATNPTLEGDTTALYIRKILEGTQVSITRLATGMPVGGDLEYADRLTIARALKARTSLG